MHAFITVGAVLWALVGAVLWALAGAVRQLWSFFIYYILYNWSFGWGIYCGTVGDVCTATSCPYSRAPAIICLRALTVFIVYPKLYCTCFRRQGKGSIFLILKKHFCKFHPVNLV